MTRAKRWLAASTGLWLVACSTSPRATQEAARSAAPVCAIAGEGTLSAEARDTVATFERSVESAPFFAASSSRSPVASCRAGIDAGMASLDYQFADGGWLRAKRNPAIEYSDVEVHFAAPPADDPLAILARAERAAFGEQGCGIDWKEAETTPASEPAGAVDTIYRGDACNCQARVRSDASGRVVGLILRSAC
jgi:hypothetical protein